MNIAETLSYEGFAPLQAEDGVVGVQVAREHLPDLIICDIMMPELDGYGVLEQLRSDPITATIPFIFLTAKTDKSSMRRGMEMGADDYLTKPFSPDELLNAITSRLEKHALLVKEYENKLSDLRGHLLRTLPHELRTPLMGILGYSELVIAEGKTLPREKIMDMVTKIHVAGLRLYRLVENYLLYAQIEILQSDQERLRSLRSYVVDQPEEIIIKTAQQTAAQAGREDDLMIQVVETQPVQVAVDSLQKIVDEVVDNAFKFSEPGQRVSVKVSIEDDSLSVTIRDEGRGMTVEQIRNIAGYMQFDRKLYEQQGSGLGLIIAQHLTQLHNGELLIDSAPGEWTRVQVLLPLK
jgi:signal transduction histidine kinase